MIFYFSSTVSFPPCVGLPFVYRSISIRLAGVQHAQGNFDGLISCLHTLMYKFKASSKDLYVSGGTDQVDQPNNGLVLSDMHTLRFG